MNLFHNIVIVTEINKKPSVEKCDVDKLSYRFVGLNYRRITGPNSAT